MKLAQNQRKLSDWESLGQFGAKKLLGSLLAAKVSLPHAFLFVGPSGVGKYQLAKEFAEKIGIVDGVKPEVYEFDFSLDNGLGELRELMKLSSLTAANQGKKIFVLRNFQLASSGSINGLLKTLEEPTPETIFLLISDSNSSLPTVLSRVVQVRCFPISETVNPNLPGILGHSLQGFPGLRIQYEENSEAMEEMKDLLQKLQVAAKQQSALVLSNQLADLDSSKLQILLRLWTNNLKNSLPQSNIVACIASIRAAQTATEDLRKNYNTKLVLQQFLQETKI